MKLQICLFFSLWANDTVFYVPSHHFIAKLYRFEAYLAIKKTFQQDDMVVNSKKLIEGVIC